MPLSLRLQPELEQRIAEYCARTGMSKSAVIARGVREFLDAHALPTPYELGKDVFEQTGSGKGEASRTVRERFGVYARARHARAKDPR